LPAARARPADAFIGGQFLLPDRLASRMELKPALFHETRGACFPRILSMGRIFTCRQAGSWPPSGSISFGCCPVPYFYRRMPGSTSDRRANDIPSTESGTIAAQSRPRIGQSQ
jgi:hypothetical protein